MKIFFAPNFLSPIIMEGVTPPDPKIKAFELSEELKDIQFSHP